jgi:hypothetical protein
MESTERVLIREIPAPSVGSISRPADCSEDRNESKCKYLSAGTESETNFSSIFFRKKPRAGRFAAVMPMFASSVVQMTRLLPDPVVTLASCNHWGYTMADVHVWSSANLDVA